MYDRKLRLLALVLGLLIAVVPSWAGAGDLQSVRMAPFAVESEPAPDLGFEPPPPGYPFKPVEQIPLSGARHGFVSTVSGNLVFRVDDMRIGGHIPLEAYRVYDSSSSAPVSGASPALTSPRWSEDFGPGWIFSYAGHLVPTVDGVMMATPEGDRIYWQSGTAGVFHKKDPCPSAHVQLVQVATDQIVETLSDGTRRTQLL